jgi:hypothetical protein
MFRNIPKLMRSVYKGKWRKLYNQRHTPALRTRTTRADDTSARARRYDTQSRELRGSRSDVHTGPETVHTSENQNRRPQRTTPTPRPRTNRAVNSITQLTRENTPHHKRTPEPPLRLPRHPQGHTPVVSSSPPPKRPEATPQSKKKSGAVALASTPTPRSHIHVANGGTTRPPS